MKSTSSIPTAKRTQVLLDVEEFRQLVDAVEELESIAAYDAAKASGGEAVPFDQAVKEIERGA
jgi:hypothetical protein